MHNNDKRDTKADTDVSFARNSNEAQKIVGNLINVRSQINTYAEGADYKNGQTLKEALEEKKKENKITPAKLLSFLFVIPLLLYAKNKGEQDDIQNKIDEEKKRVKEAIDRSIKNGGEESMMEEMKKMSKQQKYDIMKAAMKEYSSKMSDSFKKMSDDELKRIVNNLDSNIQKCPSLDQLQIDASAAFVPNAQVAQPAKVDANALTTLRQQQKKEISLGSFAIDTEIKKAIHGKKGNIQIDDIFRNKLNFENIQINDTFNIKYDGGCVQATRTSEKGINIL